MKFLEKSLILFKAKLKRLTELLSMPRKFKRSKSCLKKKKNQNQKKFSMVSKGIVTWSKIMGMSISILIAQRKKVRMCLRNSNKKISLIKSRKKLSLKMWKKASKKITQKQSVFSRKFHNTMKNKKPREIRERIKRLGFKNRKRKSSKKPQY